MWYPLAAMKGVLGALHQGDYDTAIDLLTRKALFGREREAKEAWLLLAEVYALYGEEGLEKAHHALEEAYALGGLEYDPLYRSLLAELLALEGRPEREVLPLFLPSRDPRVRYHQAQALFYLGRLEEALEALGRGFPTWPGGPRGLRGGSWSGLAATGRPPWPTSGGRSSPWAWSGTGSSWTPPPCGWRPGRGSGPFSP